MLAILDRQHGFKGGAAFDPGAVHGKLQETVLADAYIAVAAEVLRRRGHEVALLDSGPYATRHRRACELARAHAGPAAYVAAHCNAGGGSYALVEHDARSRGGLGLAEALASSFRALPGVTKAVTRGLASGQRGWVCLSGIYAGPANLCGALVEPGFIDCAAHAEGLWTPMGLQRIGVALAEGVEAWAAFSARAA